jgi:peptidoglycan hydrolase-like protein with peptidoglycan-binding domain
MLVIVLLVAGGLVALASASASVTTDSSALAKVGMPLGGGQIESVSAFAGPTNQPVPVTIRGDRIWPRRTIRAGEQVLVQVVVKRPGWISWLTGARQRVTLSFVAPKATTNQTYLTLRRSSPLRVSFDHPVAAVFYGPSSGQVHKHLLGTPSSEVVLPRSGSAGTLWLAATPRTWETAPPTALSWFPAGAATAAVASPAPASRLGTDTPISLTFSKTVSAALGNSRPPVSPRTSGSWQQVSSHTIVFQPSGYGYGLGATVRIGLPSGVRLVGGAPVWHVPPGSTLRLQQLLANLGYLPLRFNTAGTGPGNTLQAQEAAAIHPPQGNFTWRWSNVPSALRGMWQPGTSGVMTMGALMAFENNQGMTADGVAGPQVWKALLSAAIAGRQSSFGYTFVTVSESSPETESTWHNGHTVASGLVNTGIPATPTAQGTFPVFEHSPSVTMQGTNADGSHYDDPGVPWVSYFNGGDALHGFIRASYGYPQSDGCVEMPYSEAQTVYPYTPIGTLVHVD